MKHVNDRLTRFIIAGVAVAVALVLRVRGADGELWMDEIWTLRLLNDIPSPFAIFIALMHDNNHPLNSLWLYYVGPHAPPVLQRGLSIAFGEASVIATALLYWRRSLAAYVIATSLVATSYAMVHFGSEARGYSGLILFSISSFAIIERILGGDKRRVMIWLLAVWIALGVLSHIGMMQTLGVLGLWASAVMLREATSIRDVPIQMALIFWPTVALLAPIAALYAIGIANFGHHFDAFKPLDFAQTFASYGTFLSFTLATPGWDPRLTIAAFGLAALVTALFAPRNDHRPLLYLIAIVLLPVMMVAMRQPNLNFPRYFLLSGLFAIFWLSDLVAEAWRGRPALRVCAMTMIMMFAVQNTEQLNAFFTHGRSHIRDAMALISEKGDVVYAGLTPRIGIQVEFNAHDFPHRFHATPVEGKCPRLPDYVIVETWRTELPLLCNGQLALEHVQTFRNWGLSGEGIIVMRRLPG